MRTMLNIPTKLLYLSLGLLLLLNACHSKDTSNSSAFDQVKENKRNGIDSTEVVLPAPHIDTTKPKTLPDERALYRTKTEYRIKKNEQIIKELKGTPNLNVKLFKKVSALEKLNEELKALLNNYNAEEQLRWDDCRLKLNTSLDAMNIEFKEINTAAK